jgi:hypothetical protein
MQCQLEVSIDEEEDWVWVAAVLANARGDSREMIDRLLRDVVRNSISGDIASQSTGIRQISRLKPEGSQASAI